MAFSGRKSPNECSSIRSEEPCDRMGSKCAAEGYCADCKEYFCQSCFDSHIIYKPCKDHKLLDQKPTVILPVFQGKIYVQKTKDKKTCKITGMTLLTPGKLILADENNKSVKMADINKKSIVLYLKLSAPPYDVTTLTSTKVAVTLPNKKKISFISISPNKLRKTRPSQKVDGSCSGIHCYKEKLVVTYSEPVKLEILTMKGQVLNTVMIFHEPYYVTANERSIYVSNSRLQKSSVIMINWKGEKTGQTTEDLYWSTSLALLENGKVFVCDRGVRDKGHGNIHEISADCTKDKVVLKDLVNPQSVCWCDESCSLYISSNPQNEGDNEEENYLKVFKIPEFLEEL